MRRLFERSGLRLAPAQLEQFWRFHELLRARNDEYDLTRLFSFENMVLKLYVDSALVATLVDLPSPLLDLGTGAGFPGIPLKIVRPDIHLVLAEAKRARVEFLQEAVRHLGLDGVDIVPHRIGRKFDRRVAGVITRAVETMSDTLRHVSPWLPLGGRVLFMKGPESQDELDAMKNDFGSTYRITLDRRYSIPQTSHLRRLIVVERLESTIDAVTPDAEESDEPHGAAADTVLADWDEETAIAPADVPADDGPLDSDSADDRRRDEAPRRAGTPAEETLPAFESTASVHFDWDDAEDIPDLDDLEDGDEDLPTVKPEGVGALMEAPIRDTPPAVTPAPPDAATRRSEREVRDIQSTSNPTFKQLLALHSGRGVRRTGLALVAGARPVAEILRDFPDRCVGWVSDGPAGPGPDLPGHVAWYRMGRDLFRRVDTTGAGAPLLVVRVPEFAIWSDADWPPGCTLFVPFQDPENVGAILRSAAAFGVAQVVLLSEAANPFHPKSVRASGGSCLLRLRFLRGPSIRDLDVQQAPLLALSTSGSDIASFRFPATFGLLPGLEGPGLPAPLRTPDALQIPMQPGVESLNAAAATAIALFVWRQQTATPLATPRGGRR